MGQKKKKVPKGRERKVVVVERLKEQKGTKEPKGRIHWALMRCCAAVQKGKGSDSREPKEILKCY